MKTHHLIEFLEKMIQPGSADCTLMNLRTGLDRNELAELKQQLAQVRADNERLRQQIELLREQNEGLRKQNEQLQKQVGLFQAEVKELRSDSSCVETRRQATSDAVCTAALGGASEASGAESGTRPFCATRQAEFERSERDEGGGTALLPEVWRAVAGATAT